MLPSSHSNLPRLARLKKRLPGARVRSRPAKNPLWARAGARTVGGPLPGGRLTRGVGIVVFVILAGLGVRAWLGQRVSIAGQIERVVRAQYLPQLEKKLGAKIEVGAFSTDWAGRVIVDSVVVGRDATLPTGALARIGRVTLNLDLLGLAAGQREFPGAVSSVVLDGPQIYLERTRNGRFNLQKFFVSSGGKPTQWRGQISVADGRVFYLDRTRKTATGADLQLDARAVNGSADVESGEKGARFNFQAHLGQTLYGPRARDLGSLDARGFGALDQRKRPRGWIEIGAQTLPASPILEIALPKKEAMATTGTLGGRVQLGFADSKLTQRGELQLRGVSLKFNPSLGIQDRTGTPLKIGNLSGPLRFAGTALETSGISAQILGAPWRLRGRAAIAANNAKNLLFDCDISTSAAPLQALKRWIPASKTAFDWQNGAAKLRAQFRGTPSRLTASGNLETRDLRLQSGAEKAAFQSLRANFIVRRVQREPLAVAARFVVSGGQIASNRGSENLKLVAPDWSGSIIGRGKTWEVDAQATQIAFSSRRFGASRAQKIAFAASTPDFSQNLWRGQARLDSATTQNLNRALLPDDAARLVRRSGLLSLQTQFSGAGNQFDAAALRKIALAGRAALSDVQLDAAALPASIPEAVRVEIRRGASNDQLLTARSLESDFSFANGRWTARNARAQSVFGALVADANGVLNGAQSPRFTLALADFRVASARINPFLRARGVRVAGDWRGKIGISNRRGAQIAANFDLRAPQIALFDALSGNVRLRAQNANLRGDFQIPDGKTRRAPNWTARFFAREIAVQSGRIGFFNIQLPPQTSGLRLANAQLDAASTGANWTAKLVAARAAVPLGNLSPLLRGTLTLTGAQAVARPIAGGFSLARIGANWGQNGRFDGTARLQNGRLSAQILAREVDAQALQNLLQATARPFSVAAGTRLAVGNEKVDAPVFVSFNGENLAKSPSFVSWRKAPLSRLASEPHPASPPSPSEREGPPATSRAFSSLVAVVPEKSRFEPSLFEKEGGEAGWGDARQLADKGAFRQPAKTGASNRFASNFPFQLRGKINARVQISPNEPLRLSAQMALGALRLRGQNIGLQNLEVGARLENQSLVLERAVGWSEGTRVAIAGKFGLKNQIARAKIEVVGARLTRLRPFLPPQMAGAALDGLASANLDLNWNPRTGISMAGPLKLRAASAFGVDSSENEAQISAFYGANANSSRGWNFKLANWRGEIAGARFEGSIEADAGRNRWTVALATKNLEARRLTLLRAQQMRRESSGRDLLGAAPPIDGVLSADVHLTGVLRAPGGQLPLPDGGFARLSVPEMFWRGRSFGALNGDFRVKNRRLEIKTLELRALQTDLGSARTPDISLVGSVPLDVKNGEINTKIRVGSAPIGFFLSAVRDGRDALASAEISSPILDRAVSYVETLPDDLRGLVALEGAISGPLRAPQLRVENLSLRQGQMPLATGGFSPPTSFDSAFTFADGVLKVEKAEFRLKKVAEKLENVSTTSDQDAEDDDTIFTVEPGAQFSPNGSVLAVASVINANLSQIAPYVPALRGPDGTPLLSGELAEFSLRLEGTARDPALTGSIQARDLNFKGTKIEALRVARFEIAGGRARVEPGNLTIREGNFQSSAASGNLTWDWTKFGPVLDGPMAIDFPLQTRDFGALAGIFVPQLASVEAQELSGLLQVRGTPQNPRFAGKMAIKNGRFRLVSTRSPVSVGLVNLNGALAFEDGDKLVIDAQNPLSGELVDPREIEKSEAGARTKNAPAVAVGAVAPREISIAKTRIAPVAPTFLARGQWRLRGSVATNGMTFQEEISPLLLARLRYDLSFDLQNGAATGPGVSGLQNIALGAIWRTGAGAAQNSQNVRWMAVADGISGKKKIKGGEVRSIGAFALRSDFPSGLASLARSRALDFADDGDFADFAVSKRFKATDLPDLRPQIQLRDLYLGASGLGSGLAEGRLVLDNGASQQRAPDGAARLQTASDVELLPPSRLFGARDYADWNPLGARNPKTPAQNAIFRTVQDDEENVRPLRLGGILTVHDAQIVGAGTGGEGGALRLSLLPDVPRFDVRLNLGRNVSVVNSVIRARLNGEMVLTGTPRDPIILGTLETLDGQVRFPSARARIEEGRVTVAMSREPDSDVLKTRLDVDTTARGQAGRYAITLRLRGPLDLSGENSQNLKIEVTSNPPLSQDEAFKQLLGISPRETANSDGTFDVGTANDAYVSSLVSFLSAPFFSGFERSVAQALGLSNVTFDYRLNEPLAIELNRALGDRVLITYRRSVGNNSNNNVTGGEKTPYVLRIDYRLKGDLLLGLQTDERDIRSLTLQKSWRF